MPDKLSILCDEIDSALSRERVRPEDVNSRTRLLQPLEEAVLPLKDAPRVSDSIAGRIAVLLWAKTHPQQADLDWMLGLLEDKSPLVRLLVTDAVAATLESSNARWSEPQFSTLAREVLQNCREVETSPVITYNLNEITLKLARLARPRRRKRPPLILNPYVAGLPVQDKTRFFGRDDVLRHIENSFGRREGIKSVTLYGARRTGKTSILYQIKDGALGDSYLPVYIDMQAYAGSSLPFFLHSLLLSTESAALERNLIKSEQLARLKAREGEFSSVQELFKELLAILKDVTLLLMIDEYELLQAFFEKSSLNIQMQSLLEQEPRLYAIFAGSRKIEALKQKGFFNLLDTSKYIKISFLKHEDALQLITEPAAGLVKYKEGVPEKILSYTAGHPFYTQLLCQTAFDLVKTGGTITEEYLLEAVRHFMRNPSPHLILTWNGLDLEEKVVGATLAEQSYDGSYVFPQEIISGLRKEQYPVRLRQGEVQQALNVLRDIDWVEKEEGAPAYRYTMNLVRIWVTENRALSDLVEEQRERIYSKVGGFWRQTLALAVDFGVYAAFMLLSWMIMMNATDENWNKMWGFSVTVGAFLYFILPLLIAKSTLGLHLMNLRIVTTLAGPPNPARLLLYGVLSVVRLGALMLLLLMLLAVLNLYSFYYICKTSGFDYKCLMLFIAMVVIIGTDVLLMLFGKKHQSLVDMLAGTLIISAPTEGDK